MIKQMETKVVYKLKGIIKYEELFLLVMYCK